MTTTTPVRPLRSVPLSRTDGAGGEVGFELRPLAPGDSAAVLAVFAGMGSRSRWLRFLAAKPRLTSADLRRLTAVDRRDHVAVVAKTPHDHRPVGIARFIRSTDDARSAEVAVAVADAWQRRGVGTLLLGAVVERALAVGVRRFTMLVSDDNAAVLALLQRFPGGRSRVHVGHGVAEYSVSLEGARS